MIRCMAQGDVCVAGSVNAVPATADPSGRQTAYPYNAVAPSGRRAVHAPGWPPAIRRMLEQHYAFLPLQYDGTGYLFRGMRRGLGAALLNDRFWHFAADTALGRLEQELDVLFCSQDLSDALGVARLWEDAADAAILVFRSALFNAALRRQQAAMMATAEPGVIFKYPLLTLPLTARDIACFIVTPACSVGLDQARRAGLCRLAAPDRLIVCDRAALDSRQRLQAAILLEFERRGIDPAKPRASKIAPPVEGRVADH